MSSRPATLLAASGAKVIAGPVPSPAGRNLIAMHPDGSVFEYVDRQVQPEGSAAQA